MRQSGLVLGDATVERVADGAHVSPLLGLLARPAKVAELVRAALAEPRLRLAYSSPAAVVLELLDLDATGALRLSLCPLGEGLEHYYETGRADGERSLAYLATYQRNWQSQRSLYDFVEANDANAARKSFQRDIYVRHLARHLDGLASGARVLDAGCGVGRLTGELLARGLRLTCADASAEALKCAVRVGLRAGASVDSLDAQLCDVRDLCCFDDGAFDATIALELICYQDDPSVSLRELVRVTAPGGLVALSVEGLHGSCIADPKITAAAQTRVLDTGTLDIEDEISVRYFTKGGLRVLLESAGLQAIEVVGTHYTADGVFDRLATDEAFADEEQLARLAALEHAAASDPVLEPLARAWLAIARVPTSSR